MSKANQNFIDSVVSYFNPVAGIKRSQARIALGAARKYEAASKGYRTDGWVSVSSGSSVNREIRDAFTIIRDRSRDLSRNDSYGTRAISLLETNIVGTGTICTIEGQNGKQKDNLRALWNAWADSTDCDVDGLYDFYGLQALAMRACAESGESLIVRRWRKMSELAGARGRGYQIPVPFQLQVLEGDYLDHFKESVGTSGNTIRMGVEYDSQNRRVAYWIYPSHPGDSSIGIQVSVRVPAEDVRHLFRADRPGQIRGVAWGAPCIIKLRDLNKFEDAQLLRQQIAAMFAGFVRDMEMPADSTSAKEAFNPDISAGAIEFLPSGKTIEFPNLPTVSNDGHSERVLRSIAMGYGVTYEDLTGDLSGVNYSSYKAGHNAFVKNVTKWQWQLFIPRVCRPVFQWFLDAANVSKGISTEGVTGLWTPPAREMIDPTREIPALITGIRGGVLSLGEVIRERGSNLEDHLDMIKKSNDLLDKDGIVLDSDPRKTMASGILQADPASPTAETAPSKKQ